MDLTDPSYINGRVNYPNTNTTDVDDDITLCHCICSYSRIIYIYVLHYFKSFPVKITHPYAVKLLHMVPLLSSCGHQ